MVFNSITYRNMGLSKEGNKSTSRHSERSEESTSTPCHSELVSESPSVPRHSERSEESTKYSNSFVPYRMTYETLFGQPQFIKHCNAAN